jgi:hypothetical protein
MMRVHAPVGVEAFLPSYPKKMTFDIALENIQRALTRTYMPGVGCVEGV